jgi:small subunit ribosomal protein S9
MTQADDEARPSDDEGAEETPAPDAEPAPEESDAAPEAEAEAAPEKPAAVEPEAEAPEEVPAEEPTAEEAPAEEPTAEETPSEEPAEEEAPAEEPAAEAAPDEEAPAEVADEAPEQAAGEQEAERRPAKAKAEKKADVVPGADLEPIAIGEERELSAEERAAKEAEDEEIAAREARAAAADDDDEEIAPRTVSVPADAQIQATGKRKSAVARVIVRAGDGGFQVNDRKLEEYFPSTLHQALARQPLVTSGYDGSVDIRVRVHGGGISGQAGAVRHGVARALTSLEPELRADLKRRGMLTRDDRRKERKKAGLKKARKRPQFSKR